MTEDVPAQFGMLPKSSLDSTSSEKKTPVELSLVILCYKAGDSIIPFFQKVHELFQWIQIDYEIILVGNYWAHQSEDTTPQVVQRLSQQFPRTLYVAKEKKGFMGWDLKTGFQLATKKYVGFIDGDGQFPIDSILSLVYHLRQDKTDLAKTYRVVRGDGLYRFLISTGFNFLFRCLFGVNYKDINSKPKIFRKSLLDKMKLESDDWFIDAEMMIKAQKFQAQVVEVPIHFIENQQRVSFVRLSAIWEFLKNLFHWYFAARALSTDPLGQLNQKSSTKKS